MGKTYGFTDAERAQMEQTLAGLKAVLAHPVVHGTNIPLSPNAVRAIQQDHDRLEWLLAPVPSFDEALKIAAQTKWPV